MDDAGLVTVESAHPAAETLSRLEEGVKSKGGRIFATIDHAAAAAEVGLRLRPTVVLIFGDPHAGTGLMQAGQTVGLDLPLKALVWEDAAGHAFVTYNDPRWIARRHGLTGAAAETAGKLAAGLEGLVSAAAGGLRAGPG
ncbi:MAG TPA: DUF302 domain-containing protein [Caulobacteraceae bacterium]|jgi:uncharacterized protein (DUF302 family)|nr:DUF302 domain-containing protein [Caulobacteraceae bacterium]